MTVGITLAVLALLIGAFVLFRRRKAKQRRLQEQRLQQHHQLVGPAMQASDPQTPYPGQPPIYPELASNPTVAHPMTPSGPMYELPTSYPMGEIKPSAGTPQGGYHQPYYPK